MGSWGTSDSTGSSFRGRPPRPNGSYGGNGLLGHGLLGQQVQGTAYLARGCAQGCDRGMRTGMRSWEAVVGIPSPGSGCQARGGAQYHAVGGHLLLDVDAVFDPIVDLINGGAANLSPVTLGTGLLAFAT